MACLRACAPSSRRDGMMSTRSSFAVRGTSPPPPPPVGWSWLRDKSALLCRRPLAALLNFLQQRSACLVVHAADPNCGMLGKKSTSESFFFKQILCYNKSRHAFRKLKNLILNMCYKINAFKLISKLKFNWVSKMLEICGAYWGISKIKETTGSGYYKNRMCH